MRLQQWAANDWLRPHQTTRSQIGDLLAIVEHDSADSECDLSVDWQFGIAYNATLKLCTIQLYGSGHGAEEKERASPFPARQHPPSPAGNSVAHPPPTLSKPS